MCPLHQLMADVLNIVGAMFQRAEIAVPSKPVLLTGALDNFPVKLVPCSVWPDVLQLASVFPVDWFQWFVGSISL